MTNANNNGNIEKVMAVHKQQKDDILELYTSFINSYDGSADAFENSEPFMNDLCYENKVLWYLLTVLTYQSHVTSL